MSEYVICPKCNRGKAQNIGSDYYECLWDSCVEKCNIPFRFHKSEAGKIDPNKFKKFKDSLKIKEP